MSTNPQAQSQTATALVDPLAKEPTQHTIEANQKVLQEQDFPDDTHDYASADRGFRATLDANGVLTTQRAYNVKIFQPGNPLPIWNLGKYSFLAPPTPTPTTPPAPATVNPSLWRQAKINMHNGLFHVTERKYKLDGVEVTRRIYQVRAFDLSNMTIVETDYGIIVIDPLISTYTAKAALNLYYDFHQLTPSAKPVKAVIYTHSHIDHYGGVNGILHAVPNLNQLQILAPEGFLDHAISENAFAGNAMGRRATYMYGSFLLDNALGKVDSGLGKGVSIGDTGLIAPTDEIKLNDAPREIDGVVIDFMLAQDTEAPSEMLFHFPQFNALCAAEDMTHNLHNLYSIRGSQVRNAMAWWKVINDATQLWANKTDVLFAQHHWPIWNDTSDLVGYLKKQRDLYKYILDQSLRLLNHGRNMIELSEMLVLPESLSSKWYNRGYYGTVNHDSKAVYQRYLGWYDANPANLHTLPPVEDSMKYLEYMGGAPAVLNKARNDFNNGNYRWVAEVVNHVIFADPNSNSPNPTGLTLEAKNLQADALEQMGYQAESGPWRNAYLTGAHELRYGKQASPTAMLSPSVVNAMTLDQYFDYMGLRFNAPNAETALASSPTKNWTINWLVLHDSGDKEYYGMEFLDFTLPYTNYTDQGQFPPPTTGIPTITVTINRADLNSFAIFPNPGQAGQEFMAWVSQGKVQVQGDPLLVKFILDRLDIFPANFNIVTPRPDEN